MMLQNSYPIITTDQFQKTVAFYEDYFEFGSVLEVEGYAVLQDQGNAESMIAIIDSANENIPTPFRKPTSGMILNYHVADVVAAYDKMYLEGLEIVTAPQHSTCGRLHFFVKDPNGILINVAAVIDVSQTDLESYPKLPIAS